MVWLEWRRDYRVLDGRNTRLTRCPSSVPLFKERLCRMLVSDMSIATLLERVRGVSRDAWIAADLAQAARCGALTAQCAGGC